MENYVHSSVMLSAVRTNQVSCTIEEVSDASRWLCWEESFRFDRKGMGGRSELHEERISKVNQSNSAKDDLRGFDRAKFDGAQRVADDQEASFLPKNC